MKLRNRQTLPNYANVKIISIVTAFALLSSIITISAAFGENTNIEKIKTKSIEKKDITKKIVQDKIKKEPKQATAKKVQTTKLPQTNATVQQVKPLTDPLEVQKSACKQKETER